VSEIALGANNFGGRLDEQESVAVIRAAVELGINLIDTADVYNAGRSEEIVGRAIRGCRDDVVVATKAGMPSEEGEHEGGLSASHLQWSVERSMRSLGVDHIDLLQLHIADPSTPIEETLGALDALVRAGSVRAVGCSNFFAWEVAEAATTARLREWPPLASVSAEWSLLHREPERELVSAAAHLGVGLLPYRPLAQGFLTGKYARGAAPRPGTRFDVAPEHGKARLSDGNFDVLDGLAAVAAAREMPIVALAFAYLLSYDEVSSVLVGASSPAQLAANVQAAAGPFDGDLHLQLAGVLPDLGGHRLGLPHLRRPARRAGIAGGD
jgi:aryl-alcohol dehydrogenase-like predicted oxidoreductase